MTFVNIAINVLQLQKTPWWIPVMKTLASIMIRFTAKLASSFQILALLTTFSLLPGIRIGFVSHVIDFVLQTVYPNQIVTNHVGP
jgi:hypothetical protein